MAISHAEFVTMLQSVADLYKESLIGFGRENAEDVIALASAISASAKGDYASELSGDAAGFRSRYAAIVSPGTMRASFDIVFRSLLKDLIDNKGNLNPSSAWLLIYDYFRNNNYSVQSRGITYDTSATEAGTGNGALKRLTVNRYGRTIEGGDCPLDIQAACTADQAAGVNAGEEVFQLSALRRAFDILDRGTTVGFEAPANLRALNSDGILTDHSFQISDAAVPDPVNLGAWIDSVGTYGSAKYALVADADMSSVEEVASGVPLSLEIKGNHTIYQDFTLSDLQSPHFWSIRSKAGSSLSDGDITITWGSKTQVIDLTTLTTLGTWKTVFVTLDKNCFPYNFANATNRFQIAVSDLTGDTVRVDLVRFRPMTQWNGTWWALDSGATQFLAGVNQKTFDFSDVLAGSDVIINQLLRYAYGVGYDLPANPAATQVTASGGRTLTFANSGGSDTITASGGSFITDGYEVGMIVTIAGTSSNNLTTGPLVAVTATVLTFGAATSLANEGPLSATATLNATAPIMDP